MVMVIRAMVIIMRMIAMLVMGIAMMLLIEIVRPSHSIADIPSKHTAGSSTSCFTAVENQTKTSVHHLRQPIMMMVSYSNNDEEEDYGFIATKNQTKTSIDSTRKKVNFFSLNNPHKYSRKYSCR